MAARGWARTGASAALGLAIGLVVPLPHVSTPTPMPITDRPAASTAPECSEPGSARVLGQAWQELERAERDLRDAQREIADLIGGPRGFAGEPAPLRPDRIEDTVHAWLDPDAATLEWVDCAEAPCIAVLRLPDGVALSGPAIRDAADPLRDGLGVRYPYEAFGVAAGNYVTVPLGAHHDDDLWHQRTDLREELIIAELGAALRGQR